MSDLLDQVLLWTIHVAENMIEIAISLLFEIGLGVREVVSDQVEVEVWPV